MKGAVKVFNAITIIFIVILIFWFTQLDYGDMSFENNRSAYLGVSSIVLMIIAIQMIKRSLKNAKKKEK